MRLDNDESTAGGRGGVSRRKVVAGSLWTVPTIVAAAPAASAGISLCTVNAGINVGPLRTSRMRAICSANSQTPGGGPTIWCDYGYVWGPQYLEICNCTNDAAWYSWRETDEVSNFQIEVNGVQDDENGPGRGWRPPFKLNPVGQSGGCQQFNLTYRTSATRPYNPSTTNPTTGSWTSNTLHITLYRNPSTSASTPAYPGPNADGTGSGWSIVTTVNVSGLKIWRSARNTANTGDPVNFSNCTPQGGCPGARVAPVAPVAPDSEAQSSPGAGSGGD